MFEFTRRSRIYTSYKNTRETSTTDIFCPLLSPNLYIADGRQEKWKPQT